MKSKKVLIAVTVIASLVVLLLVLYSYGGMWVRSPEMVAEYDRMVAEDAVPRVNDRFVIPILGCTCHSDDPFTQAEHSNVRLSECSYCH